MLSSAEVVLELMQRNFTASLKEAEAAMQNVNWDDIYGKLTASWAVELWDGTTPINGTAPDEVRKAYGLGQSDKALVVKRDGGIIIFQPYDPVTREKITEENYKAIGQKMIEQLILPQVKEEYLKRIMLEIIKARG